MVSLLLHKTEARLSVNNKDTIRVNGVSPTKLVRLY